MLQHLYINNYALIDELDIDFCSGFSVITGETGAGKSIILGAIALLLGQRADTKVIKNGCQKCTIEAQFDIKAEHKEEWFQANDLDIEDGICIIRRELLSTGKSRGFINDTPVTLQQMKELGESLIDVHSQHQNLLLNKESFQLNVIDTIGKHQKPLDDYQQTFTQYRKARRELEEMRESIATSSNNEEMLRFQYDELSGAKLKIGEQEALEEEQAITEHTEEIKSALYESFDLLNAEGKIIDSLFATQKRLTFVSQYHSKVAELSQRVDEAYIELKDIGEEIANEVEDLEFDGNRLEAVNSRLDIIYTLERKYRKDSITELLAEQERIEKILSTIDNSDLCLKEKEDEVNNLLALITTKAAALTDIRTKVAARIEKEIQKRLLLLGMPDAIFRIDITKSDYSNTGQDSVTFLFSANKGTLPQPISNVASGGEIARVMLSLKDVISQSAQLPTIIFDEIDTGVSGNIAEKMADIMTSMGNNGLQVISITHLPQIASRGAHHYKVEKTSGTTSTSSTMRRLSDEDRIDEIAQMLSGANITDAARNNARALLGA